MRDDDPTIEPLAHLVYDLKDELHQEKMKNLDQFAAAALSGILANPDLSYNRDGCLDLEKSAALAYAAAHEMLDYRKKAFLPKDPT